VISFLLDNKTYVFNLLRSATVVITGGFRPSAPDRKEAAKHRRI
jgi:hypothetical protein